MIEKLSSVPTADAFTLQMRIDHDTHTVERGYFLFKRDSDTITAAKININRYYENLIENGYKKI